MEVVIDFADLAQPTIRLQNTTTQHEWLQYGAEPLAAYNSYDTLGTALAYPQLLKLLDTAKNRAYYEHWFGSVVPAALNIVRRGFGHLDRERLAKYKSELSAKLTAIDERIMAKVSLFAEMLEAADKWLAADEAADWAAAHAKNSAKKRPKPESEVLPTRALSRQKRYESKLKAIEKARATFIGSRGENGKLAAWLFGEAGFKPAPAAPALKRPARSTAKPALMYIYTHMRKKDEPNRWILETLFHRARLNTIRTRYLNFATGADNRVYPRLRLYSAETFRWAYSDPPLHQWPPEIRHLIVARPGHIFVSADYSQLEARIMAYYAKELRDIEAFEDPARDVHIESAMAIYEVLHAITPEAVAQLRALYAAGGKPKANYAVVFPAWGAIDATTRDDMRDGGKKKRYETAYGASESGAGAQKLYCPCPEEACRRSAKQGLNLSPAQNRRIAKLWARNQERTMRWRERIYESTIANGRRWVSPFGYTRQFAAPAKDMRNSCYNNPLQSGAAEITNRAVVALDRTGWPIVLQMHDQIVLEVPEPQREAAALALKTEMERPVPELGGVVFPVDIHSGLDWSQLK